MDAFNIQAGDLVFFRNGGKSEVFLTEPALGYEEYRRYIQFQGCSQGITVARTGQLIARDLGQPVPGCPFDIIRFEKPFTDSKVQEGK